jgi:hypothetical protein
MPWELWALTCGVVVTAGAPGVAGAGVDAVVEPVLGAGVDVGATSGAGAELVVSTGGAVSLAVVVGATSSLASELAGTSSAIPATHVSRQSRILEGLIVALAQFPRR